jgi:hypothetical protein
MSETLKTDNSLWSVARIDGFERSKMIALGGMGIVFGLGVLALSYFGLVGAVPAIAETGDRLAFALPWMCVPVLALQAGMMAVAGGRLVSPYVDGSPPPSGTSLDMHRRFITNTVEQLAMYIPIQLALVTLLPDDRLALIPAWAVLFLVARIIFWVGYMTNPVYRATGFLMTAVPNSFALLYVVFRAVV